MAEIVRVRLGDETYALRTDKDPALLEQAAALADGRIADLRASVGNRGAAAPLAALALADELLDARRQIETMRVLVGTALDRTFGRLDAIDAALANAPADDVGASAGDAP